MSGRACAYSRKKRWGHHEPTPVFPPNRYIRAPLCRCVVRAALPMAGLYACPMEFQYERKAPLETKHDRLGTALCARPTNASIWRHLLRLPVRSSAPQ
jgi:hypothetical protein